ncbi:MAG: helix-turn-helix domain-containing protein, partial [Planctomycetes bacterium]|nr:helix-turn-helix domain-containing protein [Planctomycetota bacterium]
TGLSASRLSRLFKQQIGLALVDYRNRLRIERFLAAPRMPEASLLDAALAAGFGSYPQFHRVFKRMMGCAPAAYERAQRG